MAISSPANTLPAHPAAAPTPAHRIIDHHPRQFTAHHSHNHFLIPSRAYLRGIFLAVCDSTTSKTNQHHQPRPSSTNTSLPLVVASVSPAIMERFRSLLGGGMNLGGAAPGTVCFLSSILSSSLHPPLLHHPLTPACPGQHKPDRQLRDGPHLVARPPQDAAPRPRRCAHGSHGLDAGRVRRRLHRARGGCVCHAPERHGCQRRGCRPGLPDEDDGHAAADGQVRLVATGALFPCVSPSPTPPSN